MLSAWPKESKQGIQSRQEGFHILAIMDFATIDPLLRKSYIRHLTIIQNPLLSKVQIQEDLFIKRGLITGPSCPPPSDNSPR